MTRSFLFQSAVSFITGLGVVAFCPPADACDYRVRVGYTPVYTPQVVAVTPYVAVQAVQVPLYSVGYSTGSSTSPEVMLLLQQLVQSNQDQAQRIQRLEGGAKVSPPTPGTMPPAAPEGVPPPQQATQTWTSCVKCHSQEDNAVKGDNHILFAQGQPTRWDSATMLEVVDRVTRPADAKGTMPKGGPALTGDQVEAMFADMKRMASVAIKP